MRVRDQAPVRIDEEHALYFRARRSHLAGSGAADPAAAAHAIVGAQAQQEGPALFALSQRTGGRPTAGAVKRELIDRRPPTLVRTWGQRDTLHVYDPADWATVIAARQEWPQSGRRDAMPTDADVEVARRLFEQADGPLLRRDLFEFIPQRYVDEVAEHPYAGAEPIRLASTRLISRLAMSGELCFASKSGSEQGYVHREQWFPDLAWPEALDPQAAATELTRRYLGVFGPATPADIAHFFGARVGSVKTWLEVLAAELTSVSCGERKGLLALTEDLEPLQAKPPRGDDWPVRLLPKWDTHLMTHKDKSWVVPHADEAPLVWRKAADIAATVLARGRVVATCSHKATRKRLVVEVTPLSTWRKTFRAAVEREAAAMAGHLELPDVEVEIATG